MSIWFRYFLRNIGRGLLYLGLGVALTGCRFDLPEVGRTATPEPVQADCFVYFYLSAWVDADGDGVRDEGEVPLEGVEFYVGGMYAYSMKHGRATSDENGEASIDTWTPESCPESFTVSAEVPEGYQLTTDSPMTHDGSSGLGGRYEFGFLPAKD